MPDPDEVAAAIARNTRELRAERQWTLDQLAARSEVSKGMLVQIEQARTNPSIATLCRVGGPPPGGPPPRGGRPPPAPRGGGGAAGAGGRLGGGGGGSAGDLLVGTDRNEHVELWRWHLAADDSHQSEGHEVGTRELLTVLSGTLTLEVGDESHQVPAGGAVLFEADRPHTYRNDHRRALDMVLVVVQPPSLETGAASHPG